MVAQQVAVREPEPVGLPAMEGVPRPEPVPTIDRPGVQRPSNRRPNSVVRRRRVVSVLTALTAGTLLAALFSGATAAWWVLLLVVATWAAYLLLLHHVRRVLAEREFAALLGPGGAEDPGWEGLKLPYTGADFAAAVPVAPGRAAQTWALARFVLANIAGWALSPVVFFTALLLGKTPQDTTGQRWLANLQAAQERLREQSLRTLAISATTASVTAAGTVAAIAGSGTASAATLPTSAIPTTGAGLPAAVTSTTYRVMAGDTLGSIAARFGTTWSALAALNHLANPNLIYVGQVLQIGGSSSGGSGPSWGTPAGATYRVMAGDTLGSIAARFGTTWSALAALNHLANPNLIYAGQVLRLTGSAAAPTATATTAATATGGVASGGTYRVAAGDTLGSIAARFGTTWSALAALNHLANPNLIYAGEILRVSGSGGGSPASPAAPASPAPAAPAPAPAPAPSTAGAVAARVALEQVGKPYQWAGAGPNSFDCSGLVMYAWAHAGVSLPHYSVAQYQDTVRISRGQLQPGDLVFYDTGGGAQPGHVTIYVGNGQIVTADSPGTVVRVEVVNWDGVPMGYGRVR